jgi:hypothetical protein
MAMNTYTLLKAEVIDWLNRNGFTTLEDKVETFIAMGQRRIHRTCDLNTMETVLPTFTQSTATVATPVGYLRTKAMSIQSGTSNSEVNGAPYKKVVQAGRSGQPRYYAVVGENIHFGPVPDQDYTVDLVYYKALDVLSPTVSTNWLSENVPELVLFAALLEAALWLKDDNRAQIWTKSYEQIKSELLESEDRQDKEAGSLQVREAKNLYQGGNRAY